MSTHEDTNAARFAGRAADEKFFESVHPPIEISTLRWGCFALSSASWLKLPFTGWLEVSPTPSTLSAAS
jgi:hypothetical protein